MAYTKLKKQISEREITGIHLIYGAEEYLKAHYLKQIEKLVVGDGFADFNLIDLEGKGLDVNVLVESIEAYPVMSEKKLVIVHDLPAVSMSDGLLKSLEKEMQDFPPYCVLVFYYGTTEPDFKKGRAASFLKLLKKKGTVSEIDLADTGDLISWIARHFAAEKKKIAKTDARYILDSCENSMNALSGEIAKIAAYASGPVITRADIDAVITKSMDAKVYQLTDAVVRLNSDTAYHILDELFYLRTPEILMMGAIARAFSDCYKIKAALVAGADPIAAGKEFGMRDFVARNYARAVSAVDIAALRDAVAACAKTDRQIKSLRTDKRVLMEKLIAELMLLMRKGAAR